MKTILIIPSYNDGDYLSELVKGIQGNTNIPILIVDDGSDSPIDLVDDNVNIYRNKLNLGKGAALKQGFTFASDSGFTHAITMDSDLQHDPASLNSFIKFDENCDLVCGQRAMDATMPLHRQLSNKLTSTILSIICGQKIFDSQCGYRRYNIKSILELQCAENGFQFESEVLIKLSKKGERIGQVIIPTIYGSETSSIRNLKDTYKFIKLILRNIWQKN